MINKKARMSIWWIVAIILLVLVVVLAALAASRLLGLGWEDIIPGFERGNLTEEELKDLGCDEVVGTLKGEFHLIDEQKTKNFIYVSGKKSNVYWETGDSRESGGGLIRFYDAWHDDYEVGIIYPGSVESTTKEVRIMEFYDSFLEQDYKKSGLSKEQVIDLNGAFKIPNAGFLCKSKERSLVDERKKQCVESCSLYNGVCKNKAGSGEISLGGLGCKGECFVKESEAVLGDSDLSISIFSVYDNVNEFQIESERVEEVNKKNQINKNEISLEKNRGKYFAYKIESKEAYCYVIRSDVLIDKNYYEEESFLLYPDLNIPHDIKSFELVAWQPWNNKKVLKRIKINLKGEDKYKDGEIIRNKDFGEVILNSRTGDIFYIEDAEKIFRGDFMRGIFIVGERGDVEKRISKFKVKRIENNKVVIYGYYMKGDDYTKWNELDCNWWKRWSSIKLNKINQGDSLINVLDKFCALNAERI